VLNVLYVRVELSLVTEGQAMAQLVEALCYKPEGCGFDSCCCWNFSLTLSFQPQYGPGVDSASNRNVYQEYFLGGKWGWCIGLTTIPPSCDVCLEIWKPQPPGMLRPCPGLYRDCFTFTLVTEVKFLIVVSKK
jgi:hypothetical protein